MNNVQKKFITFILGLIILIMGIIALLNH